MRHENRRANDGNSKIKVPFFQNELIKSLWACSEYFSARNYFPAKHINPYQDRCSDRELATCELGARFLTY